MPEPVASGDAIDAAEQRATAPPIVIVRHRKEKKSKCSLEPLRGREGFRFLVYPLKAPVALPGYIRLAMDGPPLSRADATRGLLLLDATWRLVQPMDRAFAAVEPRTIPSFVTAYPRVSKLFADPQCGLASIEALFVAMRILGRDCSAVLAQYRFAARFLDTNRAALIALAPSTRLPVLVPAPADPALADPAPANPSNHTRAAAEETP